MAMVGRCGAADRCITPINWGSPTSATAWRSTPRGRGTTAFGPRRGSVASLPKAGASPHELVYYRLHAVIPAQAGIQGSLLNGSPGPRFRGGGEQPGVRAMDLRFTAEELAFRDEVRTFFRSALPDSIHDKM